MATSNEWAASCEWTEWHLTARGWLTGSERTDARGEILRQPPPDRALTFHFHEELKSVDSHIDRWFSEEWRDSDHLKINALLRKFGFCPERL